MKIYWTADNNPADLHTVASLLLSMEYLKEYPRVLYASEAVLDKIDFYNTIDKKTINIYRHKKAWALPKVLTMENLRNGDIHIDNDVFFTKGLPKFNNDFDFHFQCFENNKVFPEGYRDGLLKLINIYGELPQSLKGLLYQPTIDLCAYNHGVWRVNNVEVLNEFCQESIRLYKSCSNEFYDNMNIVLEQYLFYSYVKKYSLNIGVVLSGESWHEWNAISKKIGYVHLMGAKKDKRNRDLLTYLILSKLPKGLVENLKNKFGNFYL